jgi:esterase/lipase
MLLQNTVQAVKTAMDAAETASLGGLIAAKVASAAASWAALAPYIAIVAAIAAVIAIIVICVTRWDQIKQKVTEVATTVKTKVTQAWNNLKTNMSDVMDSIRSKVQSAWQTIKTNIINPIQDAYNNVTQKISDLKSKIEEKINDIKSKVSDTFQSIREKMESPIQAAKDTIDGIISTIKGWFPLSIGNIFSNLKLPHFSISGEFSLNPPSIPHIGVDWYAKGAVFDAATIIPTLYGLKGVGEKEPEAVSPVSVLQSYVGAAVQRFVPQIDYDLLAEKVAWACAKMHISIDVDKRQFGRVVREVVT